MRRRLRRPKDQPQAPETTSADDARQGPVSVGGDNFGINSTGNNALNVQYQIKQATVLSPGTLKAAGDIDAPQYLTSVPDRQGIFVGRASELAQLNAAVTARKSTTEPGVVVQAVHGLGGIGKSTLAAHYAATHHRDFTVVWWIAAHTPAGIDTGLTALATALQPTLAAVLPAEALKEWAVQWLASHDQWLVVLDNVTDPAHVKDLLARVTGGCFVITSRRSTGWHGIAAPVRLNVLAPDEAEDLLQGIVIQGRHPANDPLAGGAALCKELGYLPLAIQQAAAYIAETGITAARYLGLLAGYPMTMYHQTAEGGDGQRTIARTWRMTLDVLTEIPHAEQLLRILAFFAPENIPRSLLDGLTDPPAVVTAIGRLAAYNMITVEGDALAVHRLVQAVLRTPDAGDPHRTLDDIDQARCQAAALLDAALPGTWQEPGQWPTWRVLIPHVEALAEYTTPGTDTPTMAALLDRAGAFLADQGALPRSEALLERAVACRARVLGEEHPDTLASRHTLAIAHRAAGNLTQAIPQFERTLLDRSHVLGEDHPDTLASRHELAYAYEVAGAPDRAIPLYVRTINDRIRVLGKDHPDTLASRHGLTWAYQSSGRADQAILLHQRNIEDRTRVLGEDHPDTLASRHALACIYGGAGMRDLAILLHERTIEDRTRVLGENHPDTLDSRHALASAYGHAADWDSAIPLFERIVEDKTRVLGEDHPSTLTSRNNLARSYQNRGDLSRAILLYENTVAGYVRVLGMDHPSTITSCANLAEAYQDDGDIERAIPLYEKALAAFRQVPGEGHPDTVFVQRQLDICRRMARS
jgi:tetratricopeptide (TPR) repeat protein